MTTRKANPAAIANSKKEKIMALLCDDPRRLAREDYGL